MCKRVARDIISYLQKKTSLDTQITYKLLTVYYKFSSEANASLKLFIELYFCTGIYFFKLASTISPYSTMS